MTATGLYLHATRSPVTVRSPTQPLRISTFGDFIRFAGNHPATLEGLLELATTSGTREMSIGDDPGLGNEVTISAAISNSVGVAGTDPCIRKSGDGRLTLSGANTFNREVHVAAGVLSVAHPQALGLPGSGNGTSALSSGTLELAPDLTVTGEPLTLFGVGGGLGNPRSLGGSTLWTGPVQLVWSSCHVHVDSGDLQLSGTVSQGPVGGVVKRGAGRLILSGDNTFTGQVEVQQGSVLLGHPRGLGPAGSQATSVTSGSALEIAADLGSVSEPLSLAGSGLASQGALHSLGGANSWNAPIALAGDAAIGVASGALTIFAGGGSTVIDDGGAGHGLEKLGAGRLIVTVPTAYSGPTLVTGGVLELRGQLYDPAKVATVGSGATLAGQGALFGGLTVATGGTLAPGISTDATVSLAVGNVVFQPASILKVDLGGLVRGASYDAFTVYDHAGLDGALEVSLVDGFIPSLDDYFLLASFGSSSGAFANIVMPALPLGLGWEVTSDPRGSVEARVISTLDVEPPPPTVTQLRAAAPNPFSARTWLHYELARAGRVHLHVFDVRGRLVATLVEGVPTSPGRFDVPWRGVDGVGRPLGAGVYFARLSVDGAEIGPVRRVVLSR